MPQTWIGGRKTRQRATAGRVLTVACAVGLTAALAAAPGHAAATVTTAGATAGTAAATPPACPISGSSVQPLYLDTKYSFSERAADLVSCMTLSEKVLQLQTNNAPAIPRLGVQQ